MGSCFLKRLNFLREPLVLLIGGLKKLVLLLEALFEFRGERGVLFRGIGGCHLARSQWQGSRLIRVGIPVGRRFSAIDRVALVHDIGVVRIFVPAHRIGFQLFWRADAGRVGLAVFLRQWTSTDIERGRIGGSATHEEERGEQIMEFHGF